MNNKKENRILKQNDIVNETYTVKCFIGEGAFGEVYRVNHKFLGVQVLKLLKDDYVKKVNMDKLIAEAKILSKLTHPNIVRVFNANSFKKNDKEYYFITMGFVSGETLNNMMYREKYIRIDKAISIGMDLLRGLKTAHAQKNPIIHRDICPDNVLLSYSKEKPIALLSDFGLARALDTFKFLESSAGRYIYFAPECFWGVYLPTSDVFSAAIIFYTLITAEMPWKYNLTNIDDPEEIETIIAKARKTPLKKPSDFNEECTPEIDEVIMKALALNLENRYKNAVEFYDALEEAISKRPLVAEEKSKIKVKVVDGKKVVEARLKGKGFDEIAGMVELKEILYNDIILPLQEKELYEKYKISAPNGMLLFGPPGCGKTFISRKLSIEVGYNFIEVKPSDLASIYIHGTQEKIGKLFKEAKEKAPTIIFIDEVDALMPNRETMNDHSFSSEVNEFLAQMTDAGANDIFILAATNRPEKIDTAIMRTGRLDKVIYVPPPDYDARLTMFKMYLKGRPTEDDIDIEKLAKLTHNYVSSDIEFIVNEASRKALKERNNICNKHIMKVVEETQPSVSEKQLIKYEKFKSKRSFD